MHQITFYLDFISPYAYLAFEQLPEALMGHSTSVTYKPVLFGALLKHHGQLGPAEIAGKREWTYRQVLWLAHFHYDSLAAPAHQFSVAHLKIADPQLQQLSKEQRLALTTLAPIDYVLRRISDPSLFLKLEQQS